MKKLETFREGKSKKLYETDDADKLILEFLDIPAKTANKKKKTAGGRAATNTAISEYLFEYLASYNVPVHFIRRLDDKSLVVHKLEMIPLQLVIWNVATEGLAKKLGLKDGTLLETPVLEFYLKNTKLKNPFINDYHAYTLGICDRNEINSIIRMGSKVNAVLKSFFSRKNLLLAHFTLEFGRSGAKVMIGDELSADSLHLWEVLKDGKYDKKSFLVTPENAKNIYSKIKDRIFK